MRVNPTLLKISAAAAILWATAEGGYKLAAFLPNSHDVPTIAAGATTYEDGSKVRLGDKITRDRAVRLTQWHLGQCGDQVAAAVGDVPLSQNELDVYADFTCQFGIGNFRKSSMLRELKKLNYLGSCDALLKYRYQGKRDCSLKQNWGPDGCKGVWTRQLKRNAKCKAES